MSHDALMFQFSGDSQARLAAETLEELGYEPQLHEGGRLHIHVRNEDLTSALEIVQCYSGQLLEREPAETVAITNLAYGLDAIAIPAHIVNEDWVDSYRQEGQDGAEDNPAYPTDDHSYDRFEST